MYLPITTCHLNKMRNSCMFAIIKYRQLFFFSQIRTTELHIHISKHLFSKKNSWKVCLPKKNSYALFDLRENEGN
jgi:hypothetical protein